MDTKTQAAIIEDLREQLASTSRAVERYRQKWADAERKLAKRGTFTCSDDGYVTITPDPISIAKRVLECSDYGQELEFNSGKNTVRS